VEWLAEQMEILHYGYWAEHISKDEKNQRLKQLKEQAKAMHKEEITQAYSNGWHDGQDAIIMRIEHIDKGGDERGLKYYEQL
jgi:hypothetical protein